MNFSDRELKDYLDGALHPDRAMALETALGEDDDLARRMMALDGMAADVKAAMISAPDHQRIERLSQALPGGAEAAAPGRRLTLVAAAAVIGLVIGVGAGGFWLGEPAATGWRAEVAQYQSLYTPDTIANVAHSEETLAAQLAAAEAALGVDLPRAALGAAPGLTLVRAQVLGFAGKPLVQIVFRDDRGAPVALCLIRGDGEGEMTASTRRGMAAAEWGGGGIEYLMIGPVDAGLLERDAAKLRAALAA